MITVARLKELLAQLPDDAALVAYEGEGIGLRVIKGSQFGWIETNGNDDVSVADSEHDLLDFSSDGTRIHRDLYWKGV